MTHTDWPRYTDWTRAPIAGEVCPTWGGPALACDRCRTGSCAIAAVQAIKCAIAAVQAIKRQVTEPISPVQVMDAYARFDTTDITGARVGVACTSAQGDGATFTSTRFGQAGKLAVVDGVLCVSVVFDGEPARDVPVSAVTYVDGKCVVP